MFEEECSNMLPKMSEYFLGPSVRLAISAIVIYNCIVLSAVEIRIISHAAKVKYLRCNKNKNKMN